MKSTILLFLFIILTANVQGSSRQTNTKQQQTKSRTKENQDVLQRPKDAKAVACINQIEPDEEDISSFVKKEIPETDKGKCLLACYLEAKGLMADGKVKSSGIAKVAARIYPNNVAKTTRVRHILAHCGAIASRETEKCQAAYKLADCTTTLSEKLKL